MSKCILTYSKPKTTNFTQIHKLEPVLLQFYGQSLKFLKFEVQRKELAVDRKFVGRRSTTQPYLIYTYPSSFSSGRKRTQSTRGPCPRISAFVTTLVGEVFQAGVEWTTTSGFGSSGVILSILVL